MTGSQGEPRAALSRIASGDHRDVALSPGDRVIFSSRTIPGNEKAVNSIINALVDFGAEVITDRDALVHTSGPSAPRRDSPALRMDEAAARRSPSTARRCICTSRRRSRAPPASGQVIEIRNGQMVRLAPGKPERLDSVAHGRLYRDGRLLVPHEESGVGERRRLAFAGVVSVAIVLSDSGDVLEDPTITLRRHSRRGRRRAFGCRRSSRRRSTRRSTRCQRRRRRDAGARERSRAPRGAFGRSTSPGARSPRPSFMSRM